MRYSLGCPDEDSDSYRLHKHVVLAEQQRRPVVLMQWLHIFTGRWWGGGAFIHAAAGVPLLDLHGTDTNNITPDKNWWITLARSFMCTSAATLVPDAKGQSRLAGNMHGAHVHTTVKSIVVCKTGQVDLSCWQHDNWTKEKVWDTHCSLSWDAVCFT